MVSALILVAALVYLIALQQDLARRKIPNPLPLAILGIGLLKWIILWQFEAMLWAALASFIVFIVTAFMFWRGWMGGGDVKLLTASSFLLGAQDTYSFLMMTTLIGGLVSIIVLAVWVSTRYSKSRRVGVGDVAGGDGAAVNARMTVPYGVAISLAALWILFRQTQ